MTTIHAVIFLSVNAIASNFRFFKYYVFVLDSYRNVVRVAFVNEASHCYLGQTYFYVRSSFVEISEICYNMTPFSSILYCLGF
jgi:hypothetical protein